MGPRIVARGVRVGLDGQFDSDAIDIDTLDLEDPFGTVEDVMTTLSLRAATPDQPLSSAASKLDKVTGLAVVNEENVVVGVISIKVPTAQPARARQAGRQHGAKALLRSRPCPRPRRRRTSTA